MIVYLSARNSSLYRVSDTTLVSRFLFYDKLHTRHAYTHDYTQTLKEIEFSLLVELGRKRREWSRESRRDVPVAVPRGTIRAATRNKCFYESGGTM